MNFYNPYMYTIPNTQNVGILGRLFGRTGISISNFLTGTQKVLNIANQTIPLVKQVKPVIGKAKTMFKVMNEFKKTDIINDKVIDKKEINKEKINNKPKNDTNIQNNGPIFFQ